MLGIIFYIFAVVLLCDYARMLLRGINGSTRGVLCGATSEADS
jgi:hypothetical protein